MVSRRLATVLIGALGLMPALAIAGPPFDTDDPEPVELRHWEFYLASIYSHDMGGVSGTFPHIEVNYGAAPNLQLHVIAPAAFSEPTMGPNEYGFGDTELGVKYRFVQETKNRPQVGIFPLLEVPTGAPSKGLGAGQARFFLPVWIQKSFGAWTTYGGGGYWRNPGDGNRDYWFFGYELQKQVTKQLMLGGEIFHSTAQTTTSSDRTGFNLGGVYDFDEGHHLLLSAGRDLHGENGLSVYVALQWTFGPHEAEAATPAEKPPSFIAPLERR